MKTMKIGIDIDGVLRDWAESLKRNYRKADPKSIIKHIRDWDNYDVEPHFKGSIPVKDFFLNQKPEEIYLGAKPYRGATRFVERLKNNGHQVHLVSYQPTPLLEQLTTSWLVKQNITDVTVHYTPDKHMVGLDVMLDDSTDMLVKFTPDPSFSGIPVCIDRPWNQDWGYLRVKNYRQFEDMLTRIGGRK